MSQPESSPDHAESWRQLRASLEAGPGDKGALPWKGMGLSFLSELEGFGLPPLLRVARVADRLVFSLPDMEGLADAPRVTLTFLPGDHTVQVAYSRWDIESKAPLIDAQVSASAAVQVACGALRRLWTETRPALPIPEELRRV